MKNFTLRNAGLAALLLSFSHIAHAQTVITLGAGQTIQTAYSSTIPSTISGAYVIELSSAYTPSSESYPVTLSAKTGASSGNTITIRPAAGVTGVTSTASSTSSPLFLLNGATYITLDGRAGGAGSTNAWSMQNTASSSGAGCVELENGADNDTLQYLNLAGGSQPSTGIVYLLCNSGGPGNTNDLIQYCNIGAYGSASTAVPYNCILAYGNGSYANSYITVQYNSIHDFWSTSFGSGIGAGVSVSGTGTTTDYGDNWTITGNSFYRTGSQNYGYGQEAPVYFNASPTAATATSTGNTISNNYIGGNASALAHNDSITGMYSTWESAGGGPTVTFAGIEAFANSVDITGNTISNILLFQYNSFDGFVGIYVPQGTSGGTINIQNNTIGSSYGSGRQYFATSNSSVAIGTGVKTFTVASGLDYAGGEPIMMVDGSGSGLGCGCYAYMLGTVTSYSGSTLTVNSTSQFDSNTGTAWYIGISKGIWNVNNGFIVGIYTGETNMNATCNITGDTIGNLTSAIGYYNEVAGIVTQNGVYNITGNNIFNVTTMMNNTSSGSSGNTLAINGAIAGVSQQSTTGGVNTVSNNTIYNLYSPITGSTANNITGIELNGSSGGSANLEDANFVHDLSSANTSTGSLLYGIYMYSGSHQLTNNMIRLGIRSDTTSVKGSAAIQGITDGESGSGSVMQSVYHNTVYISGSNVTSGSVNTYCFRRNNSGNPKDVIDVRNNIFVNDRSNASGSGTHFGIGLDNNSNVTSDYNDVFGTGATFNFGQSGGTAYTTQSLWNAASSVDANSLSADPLFTDPNDTIPDFHASNSSPCNAVAGATALYPTDYYGNIRADYTPVDLGAVVIGELATGVSSVHDANLQFSIYPNPAINELTITAGNKQETGSYMLTVFNVIGEKVYSRMMDTQAPTVINVSAFAPGLYIVRLENNENAAVLKFVKTSDEN